MDRSSFLAAGIVAAAALLGLGLWNYFPAGYFHDDAIYWLLSESLRQGRYVLLSDPARPLMVNYMPGFPLLLSLSGWMGGFPVGKLVSWICTVGAGALAWRLLKRELPGPLALAALAWFAFQPTVVRYSATVLSEPFFLFLVLLCFWLGGGPEDETGNLRREICLALAAGYACWVRPAGALLGAALFLEALLRRDFRRAGLLAAALAVFQGGFSLASAVLGHGASSFLGQWKLALDGAPAGAFVSLVRDNLSYYGTYVPWMVLFPLGRWGGWLQTAPWAGGILTAVLWAFVLAGAWDVARGRNAAWAYFFALQGALLALWLRPDPRYVQPLIFPIIVFFLRGVSRVFSGTGGVRLKALALCAGTVLGLASDVRGVADNFRGVKPRLPEETLSWVRANLPGDAVVAGEMASTVYLHTGRRGTNFLRSYDPEDFLNHWLERGVSHVLVEREGAPPTRPDANEWGPVARMMLSQTERFAPVRSFDRDKLDLYAVKEDPERFRRAFALYQAGLDATDAGDWAAARDKFQAAVWESPGMSGAYDRLAEAAVRLGDLALARSSLKEAISRWPESPLLHYHAYLLMRLQNDPGAEAEKSAALVLARRHGYWPLIWRIEGGAK